MMNPIFSMTSTHEERIAYLEKNGPDVHLFDDNREISIVLLRNGKDEHHTFFRNTIVIVFPQSRSYYPIPDDAPDYFIYAPHLTSNDEIIPLNKDEADVIAFKIYELNSALEAEEAASEADKECGYCGEKLGDCYGDHEEDDRASVTSTEVRLQMRIAADHAAKMSNEIEQEKQAFQTEWADGRKRILAIHEARMAADADKQLKERMRVQAAIIEDYGSEEEFLKCRAAGDEAMRLILEGERLRQATQ
jgi:hypothetical protein